MHSRIPVRTFIAFFGITFLVTWTVIGGSFETPVIHPTRVLFPPARSTR